MEDIISNSVGEFTKFLSGQESSLKKPGSTLISFAYHVKGYGQLFCNKVNHYFKSSAKCFYYRQPEKKFCFTGVNSCITIFENGPGRFAATDKKIKEWKEKFVNNWEVLNTTRIPLFIGGMKFTVEHPDEIWNDYNDSSWFVPEYVILESAGELYLIYNFVYQKNNVKNSHTDKYKKLLESIFNTPVVPASSANTGIKEVEGNSPKDKKKWKLLVSAGIEFLPDKKADKIVYSRKVDYLLNKEPDFNYITEYLGNKYPVCTVFAYHQGNSIFFGATPEKLAAFSNGNIEIDALAGSARRGNNPAEDEMITASLLNDNKNLIEHNFVVNYIVNSLKAFTSNIEQGETGVKKLQNIQHLYTRISAQIKSAGMIFSLISELFPTPAVCGFPKKTALENIKKNEPYNRGLYSGLIGWLNLNEEAEFVVAIRSAVIKNNRLYVFAGSGIVADSVPKKNLKKLN